MTYARPEAAEEFLTRAKLDVRGLLPKTEKECLLIALYGLEKLAGWSETADDKCGTAIVSH
jgi:hypothetical protein